MGPMNGLNACKRQNRTTGARAMIAQCVADILNHLVKLSVEGIDRMYLNVYAPWLHRAGSCAVLPGTSRAAAAVRSADEPDQPEFCSEVGRLRGAARDTSRAIPQRPAQGRGDGGASAPLSA